jgi:hypothetical protein
LTLVQDGGSWPQALRRALGLLVKDDEDTQLVHAHAIELFDHA